jgi:predicted RNase H-like HicB family nuclease
MNGHHRETGTEPGLQAIWQFVSVSVTDMFPRMTGKEIAMRYLAFIHSETNRTGKTVFGISFPDFPGCISGGDTVEQAVAMGGEALALAIEGMIEDDETIPAPRTAEEIMGDPVLADERDGAVLAWVPVILAKGSPRRVTVSLDSGLLDAIDAEANRRGMTRSAFLTSAAHKEITAT